MFVVVSVIIRFWCFNWFVFGSRIGNKPNIFRIFVPEIKVETDMETHPDKRHKSPVKIRFKQLADGCKSIYLDTYLNGKITIENIPAKAYEYIVNGKSAIEWIMERYAITQDKKSLIVNNPNDWSKEHENPTYIFDLLLSIINVSTQTVDIINSLPKLSL